jgi:hypothetical protein
VLAVKQINCLLHVFASCLFVITTVFIQCAGTVVEWKYSINSLILKLPLTAKYVLLLNRAAIDAITRVAAEQGQLGNRCLICVQTMMDAQHMFGAIFDYPPLASSSLERSSHF